MRSEGAGRRRRAGSAAGTWKAVGAMVVAAALFAPVGARAQDGGTGYLFATPRNSFTIRTGYDVAMANSDLFSYSRSTFTLGKSDFSSPTIATELGVQLNPSLDAVLGLGYSRASAQSEYRDYLDNNNLPIQQSTDFTRIPLTVSLKAYLAPRGRTVGRYAWVPERVAPFVGAGVGTMWYSFRQGGDFIDYSTLNVNHDVLQTSGWAPMASVFAGSDFTITPGMALTTELRYSVAQGASGNDYVGFHRIDLSGMALTAGLTFRF